MNFLSIDCSTEVGSLYLKIKNKSFSKFLQTNKNNNDILMREILIFLEENNISFDDFSDILVNLGPGNFSGLRTSISITKGLCIALKKNIFGYNTFLLSSVKFYKSIVPIYSFIKFNKKYFVQKFEKKLKQNIKPKSISYENFVKKYKNKIKVVDKRYMEYLEKDIFNLDNLNIVNLDYDELKLLRKQNLLEKSHIRPIYLK